MSMNDQPKQAASADNRPLFTYIGRLPKQQPLNYFAVVASILAVGVVTLIALPLGAVWIASSADCCFADSTSSLLTFWAAILGGFIAFFGMVISGLFVVFAFRIDNAAKSETIKAVHEILGAYLEVNSSDVIRNFEEMVADSKKGIGDIVAETQREADAALNNFTSALEQKLGEAEESAQRKISEITSTVQDAGETANANIAAFSSQVEQSRIRAEKQIQQAAVQVEDARNDAVSRIGEIVAEVEQERNEALRRMQPPEDDETSGA